MDGQALKSQINWHFQEIAINNSRIVKIILSLFNPASSEFLKLLTSFPNLDNICRDKKKRSNQTEKITAWRYKAVKSFSNPHLTN